LRAGQLTLHAARDARGATCFYERADAASCLSSFNGAPGRLATLSSSGGWNLLVGLLRDGTNGIDVEISGRWHAAHIKGRGVYLASGGASLANAIQHVRYHLADGTTITCDGLDAC